MAVIQCENCGKVIGVKEMPMVYQDRTVCGSCHYKLTPKTGFAAVNESPIFHYIGLALVLLIGLAVCMVDPRYGTLIVGTVVVWSVVKMLNRK